MIYCVEDDAGIRELVVYTLRNTGFEADGFEDGAALTTALKKCKPQLILLDIMLPGEDGITILRRLRAAPDTAKIPVILLTAKNTEYDKVVGLDTGADDYIPKPFGMMELIARIRAVVVQHRAVLRDQRQTVGIYRAELLQLLPDIIHRRQVAALRHQPLPHVIGQTGVNCQQQQPGRQQQRDKRCEENAAEYALSHVCSPMR